MNDRIITFITVPFLQGKAWATGTLSLGFAEKSQDAKDLSWAKEEEDWHSQVWATQGRQHLALPTPPGSNKGLASILGSVGWDRHTEASCPEASQFWWEGGEGRIGNWVRGPRALSMVQKKWLTWGNSGQLESDPFTLSHLEMPVRGLSL